MPRSASSGSSSVVVVPLSTSPARCFAPLAEQHPLGHGRLAGIDVGDDADVADFFERNSHR